MVAQKCQAELLFENKTFYYENNYFMKQNCILKIAFFLKIFLCKQNLLLQSKTFLQNDPSVAGQQ